MSSLTRTGIKSGNELTLRFDLSLSVRNSLFGFRQQLLEGRPINNRSAAGRHNKPLVGALCDADGC